MMHFKEQYLLINSGLPVQITYYQSINTHTCTHTAEGDSSLALTEVKSAC